jgi:hypothetical protein
VPNRMLYTGLLTSDKVNKLKATEFELYVRLLLVVDDFGRFQGSSVRVARSCWPDREDITSKQVDPMLCRLHEVGLAVIYIVEDQRYLQITNWTQRSRATESKYPPMPDRCPTDDGHMTVMCPSSAHVDVDVDVDVDVLRKRSQTKTTYGEFNNVMLTEEQLEKLQERFTDWSGRIERLSSYIASKGAKYKDHYATILSWASKDVAQKPQSDAARIMSIVSNHKEANA